MSELTESERRFEEYCSCRGIQLTRIEPGKEVTPDYEMQLEGVMIAVEVKELCPNDLDKAVWQQLAVQRSVSAYCGSEDRLREKILKGSKQIKRWTHKSRPGLLVVYDNGTFGGIDLTDVKNAMYGSETWTITEFPEYTEIRPRLGAGKMCTEHQNTSLSAVAVLKEDLVCFHNVFAACPMSPTLLCKLCERQFTINLEVANQLPEWQPL